MGSNCFSALEIDAVGEILNISLGASATAVSTMLNTRVDITTPVVNVVARMSLKWTEWSRRSELRLLIYLAWREAMSCC